MNRAFLKVTQEVATLHDGNNGEWWFLDGRGCQMGDYHPSVIQALGWIYRQDFIVLAPVPSWLQLEASIQERIYLDRPELTEEQLDELVGFCIDPKGRVRLGRGIVNMSGGAEDDNPDFVPAVRFDIKEWDWAHGNLVLELPNPAIDLPHYHRIRNAFLNELQTRLKDLT